MPTPVGNPLTTGLLPLKTIFGNKNQIAHVWRGDAAIEFPCERDGVGKEHTRALRNYILAPAGPRAVCQRNACTTQYF